MKHISSSPSSCLLGNDCFSLLHTWTIWMMTRFSRVRGMNYFFRQISAWGDRWISYPEAAKTCIDSGMEVFHDRRRLRGRKKICARRQRPQAKEGDGGAMFGSLTQEFYLNGDRPREGGCFRDLSRRSCKTYSIKSESFPIRRITGRLSISFFGTGSINILSEVTDTVHVISYSHLSMASAMPLPSTC